jgi:exosortase A
MTADAPKTTNPWQKWRTHDVLWLAIVAAIAIIFWPTLSSLFFIWNNNVSYQYCWLILPIMAWLVWERRRELAQLTPHASLWGAAAMGLSAGIWLLGEAGNINLVRHAGLIFLFQSSIWAAFGWHIVRALLFPTVFAVFMIPAGEQFIAPLQQVTAWFCEKLLTLFGVPFTTDGLFIHAPNGTFEVAEACSGIRYLTTMVALGAVYANITFKSTLRRASVMLMAVVFPVVANGVRAWGIIYLGYISDNKIAQGIDHILYGWVFFVFVMLLFIAACWRFADRPLDMPAIDLATFKQAAAAKSGRDWLLPALAITAIFAATFTYSKAMWSRSATLQSPSFAAFDVPGWPHSDHADHVNYTPIYVKASKDQLAALSDGEGRFVQLYMAVYDRQADGREMVSFGNGAFQNASDDHVGWVWTGNETAPQLQSSPPPYAFTVYKGQMVRDVWQWFYVNGKILNSPAAAKLEAAKARLLGGRTDAATLIVSSERAQSKASQAAHLEKFMQALGPVDRVFKTWIIAGSLLAETQ